MPFQSRHKLPLSPKRSPKHLRNANGLPLPPRILSELDMWECHFLALASFSSKGSGLPRLGRIAFWGRGWQPTLLKVWQPPLLAYLNVCFVWILYKANFYPLFQNITQYLYISWQLTGIPLQIGEYGENINFTQTFLPFLLSKSYPWQRARRSFAQI